MVSPCKKPKEIDRIRGTHQDPCTWQSPGKEGEQWRTSSDHYVCIWGDRDWRHHQWSSHKALDEGKNLRVHPDLPCRQAAHNCLHYYNPAMSALQNIGNIKRNLFGHVSA